MPSRDDLVDEILRKLVAPAEPAGTLSVTVNSSVTEFVVDSKSLTTLKPGVFEVGSELVYVQSVSPEAGVLSGVVRGYMGTVAAAHTAGAVVRVSPTVPRVDAIRALNDTLSGLHPRLYAVATTQAPLAATGDVNLDLPADVDGVLAVNLVKPDDANWTRRSMRWRYLSNAPETAHGKAVQVFDSWPGCEVAVTYAKRPGMFSEASGTNEDFVTATGLPDWCREVVTLGASVKIVSFLDLADIAEGDPLAAGRQTAALGQARSLGQHLYALYTEALGSAEVRLRSVYDVGTIHYER